MNVAATTKSFYTNSVSQEYSMQDTLKALKNAGFTIIDWYAPQCALLRDTAAAIQVKNWEQWAEKVREMGDRLGLVFRQMHALEQNFVLEAEYTRYIHNMLEMTFRAAHILGVRDVAIHPILSAPNRRNFDHCLKDNREYFLRLADLAGTYGLRLAIENMLSKRHFDGREEWRFCTNWLEHRALVEAIGCENVGYCFDVGHAHYTGTDLYATPMAMGKRLFAIHVHDNDTFSDQHLLPWQGTIDFCQFTQGLANSGYEGNMTMEVTNAANHMPCEMAQHTLRAIYESACFLADMVENSKKGKEGAKYGLETL